MDNSPPRAPKLAYKAPLGTRWEKEKAAAGGAAAFDLPSDPKQLGPWILGECVGKGASGRVKIARHCKTGQLAAVKILPITPLTNSRASLATQKAKCEKQRLGIDREITMMKLMNHPNIMRIYDVYESEYELYLVLEYVEGGELFDFLVNRGRLPHSEALVYFKQIIYGLNYAHTFSIIHRDLKPENILIASLSPPLVKIADWGMAAFAPPSLQLETSCGSPHYASPEIVNGEKYQGNATDIWSCGVILYALLTGRLPFDDKNVRTLLGKVKLGKFQTPEFVDPIAKDLLHRMLVVDVSKRITIPEILAHPWIRSSELSSSLSMSSSPTVRQNPSLPPSPSTLASPISSPEAIDAELFSSLKIIWGRHADPDGESIKKDLCSPVGEGVHAKAFYFLLMQYRQETLKTYRSAESSAVMNGNVSHGPPALESMKFDQDWKLMDLTDDTPRNVHSKGENDTVLDLRSHRNSRAQHPRAHCPSTRSLVVPNMTRTRSNSSTRSSILREKPPLPMGPREPSVPPQEPAGLPHPYNFRPSRTQFSSVSPVPQGVSAPGAGRSGGDPKPQPPKRGNTYHAGSPQRSKQDREPLNVQILARRKSEMPHRTPLLQFGEENMQRPPYRRPSSSIGPPRPRTPSGRRRSQYPPNALPLLKFGSEPDPQLPGRPVSVVKAQFPSKISADVPPVPQLPLIKLREMDNAQPQRVMNDTADRVCGEQEGTKDVIMSAPSTEDKLRTAGVSTKLVENGNRRMVSKSETEARRIVSKSEAENKENKVGDDTWVTIEDRSAVGRGVGKEMVNVIRLTDPPQGKKRGRDPKSRSQTLDVPQLKHKRSTVLGSPISLDFPPSKNASPVVGDFRGWFSNLFGLRSNSQGNAGILYTPVASSRAQRTVETVLREFGVLVERVATSPDESVLLRCNIDQNGLDRQTSLSLKAVRFRVEIVSSPPSVSPMPLSRSTDSVAMPLDSPPILGSGDAFKFRSSVATSKSSYPVPSSPPSPSARFGTEWPAGTATAVVLTREKGSSTSFSTIWQAVKGVLGNITVAEPTCKSPTQPSAIIFERQPLAAV